MKSNWSSKVVALFVFAALLITARVNLVAQDRKDSESAPRLAWDWLKQGRISLNIRYRFETFERDGAPFTAPAYAPTLRMAAGYETPLFHGFTVFAQGEAVAVTGPADYSDPTLPSQNRPDRPAILDPKSMELSQGYVKWTHSIDHNALALAVGRQEITLNDGRFLGVSFWRQVHGSFDAVKFDADLPYNFSFTYAFIGRFNREVGYEATDGQPSMHTDMANLVWRKQDQVRVSLYALLLDYRSPAQFSLSTQTYGLRANGPFQFNRDWGLVYTAEFAKQKSYGTNPNRVDANYYLGELGPGWHGLELKAGYALLGGRSSTDELTTPLAPPRNGWTDLFFNDPNFPGGNGLEARYLSATGPVQFLGGTAATLIYYDYHSDKPRVHYGSELDMAMSYKIKRTGNRWEIGWRFGRYWADRLFTNALRTSLYTSYTL
jgi:Alginate export